MSVAYDRNARRRLARALGDLPDEYLLCRDLKHSWKLTHELHTVKDVSDPRTLLARELICTRCGSTRRDRFALSRGEIEKIGHSYVYPEDYKIPNVPRGNKPSSLVYREMYDRVQQKGGKLRR